MSKPSVNILRRNGKQSLFEGFEQIAKGSGLETTQAGLDLRPRPFNGIKVGRVRWQKDQVGATRLDQLLQPGDFVSGEIVHEQNITGLKSRDNTLLDITIKHRSSHSSRQNQRSGDPRPAHHRQGRGLRSGGLRRTVHDAPIGSRSPVQARQACIYAGFIQKFEVFHLQLRNFFLKPAALAFHPRRVPLAGMERLFFRGNRRRTNSRDIILGSDLILVFCSTTSHNSCKIPSGCAFTAARITASAAASLRGTPRHGAMAHNLPFYVSGLTSARSMAH